MALHAKQPCLSYRQIQLCLAGRSFAITSANASADKNISPFASGLRPFIGAFCRSSASAAHSPLSGWVAEK
ncbi:hypothetical protein [Campylobacter concisus]|uniref:hypothetical protein n=1 Tax=Campylobacter concisus TaxID=199 RepID=UPI001CA488E4|nr:hypothetical protein [Campylobacter concisus]